MSNDSQWSSVKKSKIHYPETIEPKTRKTASIVNKVKKKSTS